MTTHEITWCTTCNRVGHPTWECDRPDQAAADRAEALAVWASYMNDDYQAAKAAKGCSA